ncbi:uncharacterized protein LOC111086239 isoform X2 [Limulus polyphemus]|uniref:Uncharacterized protein LOC111086239 isoform X2 n=1 Tax=Limulus polyphemus TaxID=6850 RepID=A0ABM1SK75_LIMPO|nr:uncharacterized protein LOC111086239 isoform X2 [Limulus polyphemus]
MTIEHTAQKDFSKAEKGNVFSPADVLRSDSDYLPIGHLVRISQDVTSNDRPATEGSEVLKCSSSDPTKSVSSSCDGKCGNIMCSVKADPSPEWPLDMPTQPFLSTLTQTIPEECCNDKKSRSCSSADCCCNDISKLTCPSYDSHINNKLCRSHPQDFPVFSDTMVKDLSYSERKQCGKLPFLNGLESTFDAPSLILNHGKTDVPKLLGSPSNQLHSRSTSEEILSISSGNEINVCKQTNPDILIQPRNSLRHFKSQSKCRSRSRTRELPESLQLCCCRVAVRIHGYF